jgi:hypothetical protein
MEATQVENIPITRKNIDKPNNLPTDIKGQLREGSDSDSTWLSKLKNRFSQKNRENPRLEGPKVPQPENEKEAINEVRKRILEISQPESEATNTSQEIKETDSAVTTERPGEIINKPDSLDIGNVSKIQPPIETNSNDKYTKLENDINKSDKLEIDEGLIKSIDPYFKEKYGKTYIEWYDEKLRSTLEKSGNLEKDMTDFFCKSMTSLVGINAPYKNLFFNGIQIKDTPFHSRAINMDYFLKLMPNYNESAVTDALKSYTSLEIFKHDGNSFIGLSEKAYRKFIYRGEAGTGAGGSDLLSTFDTYLNQGGIGYSHMVNTAIDPVISVNQFVTHDGGFFVIKHSALNDFKNEPTNLGETLQLFNDEIPLNYVEKFFVNENMKNKLFEKYGPDNTQIFGKPLKDVVRPFDNNIELFRSELLKKLIEENTRQEDQPT